MPTSDFQPIRLLDSGFWYIHLLNDKQCRSRSVGFWRSQLIWIYTVCKRRVYLGSVGQGLINRFISIISLWLSALDKVKYTCKCFDIITSEDTLWLGSALLKLCSLTFWLMVLFHDRFDEFSWCLKSKLVNFTCKNYFIGPHQVRRCLQDE